nr:DUF3833 family protein [Aliikangiella coralliicola]
MLLRLILLLTSLGLLSCSVKQESYLDNTPKLDFADYFNGKLCAWGVVRERSGELSRKFVADINAYSLAESIVLDEVFLFDDGERQTRQWKFKLSGGQWIGTAGDVVDTAIGEVVGDSLHLNYQLEVKVDGDSWVINMDDWLHLIDRRTLMGTTNMSKWGFNVGRIDILMRKQPGGSARCINEPH